MANTTHFELAFSLLDGNSDGVIGFKELETICTALDLEVSQKDLVEMVAATLSECGRSISKIPSPRDRAKKKVTFLEKYGYDEDELAMDWDVFYKMIDIELDERDLKLMWSLFGPKRARGKEVLPMEDVGNVLEVLSGPSEKWSETEISEMLSDIGASESLHSSIQFSHFKKLWEGTDKTRERASKKASLEPQEKPREEEEAKEEEEEKNHAKKKEPHDADKREEDDADKRETHDADKRETHDADKMERDEPHKKEKNDKKIKRGTDHKEKVEKTAKKEKKRNDGRGDKNEEDKSPKLSGENDGEAQGQWVPGKSPRGDTPTKSPRQDSLLAKSPRGLPTKQSPRNSQKKLGKREKSSKKSKTKAKKERQEK